MHQCGNINLIGCNRTVVYEVPDLWATSHVRSVQFSRRTDVRHRGSIRIYSIAYSPVRHVGEHTTVLRVPRSSKATTGYTQ